MQVVVLVKQVADTDARIKLADGKQDIDRQSASLIVNPYDEMAVEEALRIREKHGATVWVVTLGEAKAEEALRTALAMGADEAARITAPVSDPLTSAKALAQAVREIAADIVIAGRSAADDEQGQVGALVAVELGWPHVTEVTKLEITGAEGVAEREVEGGVEVLDFTLPVVVTAQEGLNTPRYASLPGIMKAKRKEIRQIAVDGALLGEQVLATRSLDLPPARAQGKILTGLEPADAAKELVRILHEEAKLI